MTLHIIDIPIWMHPFLWVAWFAWCWGMIKMSDLAEDGCGWVGHQ